MFSFCKPVSSKKRFLPFRKINESFSFSLYAHGASVPAADWEAVAGIDSVFLDRTYLQILEKSEHTRLSCRYVIVYSNARPCGIIYYQVVDFKAGIFGSVLTSQFDKLRSRRVSVFERYLNSNSDEVLLRLFTCGNNLVSGEYGFKFLPEIRQEIQTELVFTITDLEAREEKLRGTISAILIKDFYQPLKPARIVENVGYSEFFVEPNMIVDIPETIKSLSEYTALFSKKYRNRAKSVMASLAGLEVRYLDANEIKASEKELYSLYEQIFEKAKFRLIKLPADYFSEVKELFKDQFTVKGYFKDGVIVAFASSFVIGKELEAHYIGFNYEENGAHDLYQNILYSMIEEGIKNNCVRVNLGRTASEIKTTVGAKPHNLLCYIRSQNTISRLIQRPFISFLQPAKWTPRNPFKEEISAVK
jgi:hypothetical protein